LFSLVARQWFIFEEEGPDFPPEIVVVRPPPRFAVSQVNTELLA
jgi:hypothetical protein